PGATCIPVERVATISMRCFPKAGPWSRGIVNWPFSMAPPVAGPGVGSIGIKAIRRFSSGAPLTFTVPETSTRSNSASSPQPAPGGRAGGRLARRKGDPAFLQRGAIDIHGSGTFHPFKFLFLSTTGPLKQQQRAGDGDGPSAFQHGKSPLDIMADTMSTAHPRR